MQLTSDMGVLAYLSTAVLSVVLSVFLLALWLGRRTTCTQTYLFCLE